MSVIVCSGSDLCKSQVNTSLSKQMFSFSKAPRFPKVEMEVLPEDEKDRENYRKAYIPNTRSTIAASIGKGERYDFTGGGLSRSTKLKKGPVLTEPNQQQTKTNQQQDDEAPFFFRGTPAYSFGISREQAYGGIFPKQSKRLKTEPTSPEPTKTDKNGKQEKDDSLITKGFGYDGIKYSMRGYPVIDPAVKKRIEERDRPKIDEKLLNKKDDEDKHKVYSDAYSIKDKGRYYLSHLQNVSTLKFAGKEVMRFKYNYGNVPGPGRYGEVEQGKLIPSLMGNIFNSRYRSQQPKTMFQRYKITNSRDDNPGPGEYVMPSDFGIYKSKNAGEDVKRERVKKYENYIPVIREERLRRIQEAKERRAEEEEKDMVYEDEEVDKEANEMEEGKLENEGKEEKKEEGEGDAEKKKEEGVKKDNENDNKGNVEVYVDQGDENKKENKGEEVKENKGEEVKENDKKEETVYEDKDDEPKQNTGDEVKENTGDEVKENKGEEVYEDKDDEPKQNTGDEVKQNKGEEVYEDNDDKQGDVNNNAHAVVAEQPNEENKDTNENGNEQAFEEEQEKQ